MKEKHVVFGTGPLGLATARALQRRGLSIRMINRSGELPADATTGLEITGGDATNLDFTLFVCKDATVVYQCAQPAYHEWVEKFPPLQAAILEGAAMNGARLIVAENLYMYGDTNGQPIHEELPYAARTRKGKVRAEMAEALIAAHRIGKVQVAMGRGSDFYGPTVLGSSLGERTFKPALAGKPAELTGSADQPHTYTYIDDFGAALAVLGERDEALGQAWHVPNPPTLTQRQLLELAYEEIGLPFKMRTMGRMMMTLGGLFIPEARETVEMMYEFVKPFQVDASKFIRAFGDLATPHEIGLKATVTWFRDRLSGAHAQVYRSSTQMGT
jgi:nucleoside-diphosphate-sugar epimerase